MDGVYCTEGLRLVFNTMTDDHLSPNLILADLYSRWYFVLYGVCNYFAVARFC